MLLKWSGMTWTDLGTFPDWHDLTYWLNLTLKLALEDLNPPKNGIQ